MGRKAWGELSQAVKDQQRAAKKKRRDDIEQKKRRGELDAMGFKPLNGIDLSARKKALVVLVALAVSGCAGVKKFHKAIIPEEPPVFILPTGFPGISWIYDVRRTP